MNLDTNLKLKVSVTYTWEETIDPRDYDGEYISNVKEHYILTGAYQDRIAKLDTCADNCLPKGYKCSVDVNWM